MVKGWPDWRCSAVNRCRPAICQEDTSGNVKPGAKAVNAQAAVALPVKNGEGEIRGVVGIAFQQEREFTTADLDELTRAASGMPD